MKGVEEQETSQIVDQTPTEEYLKSLPGVIDSTVWWFKNQLTALVTVGSNCEISPLELKQGCFQNLGLHRTPKNVYLVLVGNPAQQKELQA